MSYEGELVYLVTIKAPIRVLPSQVVSGLKCTCEALSSVHVVTRKLLRASSRAGILDVH
jgi:hypothetical protein